MGSHKSRDDEIYEQGVHDGQRSDAMDQFSHNLVKGYTLDPRTNEIYNAGYEYGLAHRRQEEHDDSGSRWATSSTTSPRQEATNDDGASEVLGKLIGYGIVIFAIVWLVVAVVIPLLVLDIPIILLGVAVLRPGARRFVLPLAPLVSCYLFVDFNQGWLTREFAINAPFLAAFIKPLLYANLCAALVASYLLLKEHLAARYPLRLPEGRYTHHHAALVASLALVGTVVVSTQELQDRRVDSRGTYRVAPTSSSGASGPTSRGPVSGAAPARPGVGTAPAGGAVSNSADVFVRRAVIDDPDGYTNVRRFESATSDIIGRVVTGEQFFTYRQDGNWWRVRTQGGVIGYMHVSRIALLP